jgi:hypothetical protein
MNGEIQVMHRMPMNTERVEQWRNKKVSSRHSLHKSSCDTIGNRIKRKRSCIRIDARRIAGSCGSGANKLSIENGTAARKVQAINASSRTVICCHIGR